jgi:hypothetical protein
MSNSELILLNLSIIIEIVEMKFLFITIPGLRFLDENSLGKIV